jgi:hypothetical protein
MHEFCASTEKLTDFMQAFEAGRLPRERWTHAAHIAVGTVFTLRLGDAVLMPMREAIQRHNASVGTPPGAYHETLTIFWLAILARTLSTSTWNDDLAIVQHTVALYGSERRLHERFYSFDLLTSHEARSSWVAPDLQPLDVSSLLTSS